MNGKQRKTLIAMFTDPVSASIEWRDIDALFVAIGCQVIEGSGSRVRFNLKGAIASFHRPHPDKEAKRYQVREAREFLKQIGVTP
jgi:HicA toxin of bacterial toxin-antitoxin,